MVIKADRIGKAALMLSMSSREEEEAFMEYALQCIPHARLAVTVVSGLTGEIKGSFTKAIVGCSLQNGLVRKSSGQIHAVIHASLDALEGIIKQVPSEASMKLKVAIVTDEDWVAVAVYGDSAFYPITNHERCSLGVMHLR